MKMRSIGWGLLGAGVMVSCDVEPREEETAIPEAREVAADEEGELERTIEEMQTEFDEMPPPEEPDEEIPEPEAGRTPGDRLDDALDATGRGLRTAGEKTEEGLETAAEKTGEGLQKAAEATGRFLQRTGEKLEEAAQD